MIQAWLQRLARFLDRPFFPWKKLVVGFSLGQFALENWLLYRQYKVYQQTAKPKALTDEITQETFDKSQDYSRAKARFSVISSLFNEAKSMYMLYIDIFPLGWALAGAAVAQWLPAPFTGEITRSLIFVFGLSILDTVLGLPFDYYRHFVLEEAYGFNKMTRGLWIVDALKGLALTVAIGTPIGAAFLSIVHRTGSAFFYYLWLFMVAFQLLAVTLYPIVIVPMFNKLTPLAPGPLRDDVEALCRRLKFPLDELSVIDGSKRSAHSNAYFSGLPWKKRIVLFDTLIEQSSGKEVEAVLAHELGHWKMGHTTRILLVHQAHLFYLLAAWSSFIGNRSLYAAFGFEKERPIMIGFMLFNMIYAPVEVVVQLMMNLFTRRMEYQADSFANDLGYKTDLAKSLIKLQIKNLSAMDADWLYSSFHHSHPILTERLKAIGWVSDGKPATADLKEENAVKEEEVVAASGREL
ncbi:CaaX prenyl protease [Eremomyces bilateralis CBS 781.70]|uniref:CAAX prenyl protease n=1 Tax=Eremomyces bilateralis CBS 781.70 TaxID=1392243 RepID=A0A6G1GC62_9PEZI|nr:CaaX prenyl protease [Eremomyces bilateralis CBS 781.70]KAF1815677.1 CaaX prenyl protease [Eremomyces bilateralis CBS 781.70]